MGSVYVVGTLDTKGDEHRYVRDLIEAAGLSTTLVDVGTTGGGSGADVTADEVAAFHPDGASAVLVDDRGAAVVAMSDALVRFIEDREDLDGIISLGGSGGTSLVTPAMQALAVGIPKVMVSTMASGDVRPYVGPSDITMMYSVTDVAGINGISSQVFSNAAHAVAGMSSGPAPEPVERDAIGLTMFGVTTPLVTMIAETLSDEYDCLVFHATGTGGQSMEKLVDSGLVAGVIDRPLPRCVTSSWEASSPQVRVAWTRSQELRSHTSEAAEPLTWSTSGRRRQSRRSSKTGISTSTTPR